MRNGDRYYVAWNQMPVVNGTRYYERVPLDNAASWAVQIFSTNGATGNYSYLATNLDNTISTPIDADAITNMQTFSAGGSLTANGMAMTSNSSALCAAHYLFINFIATANGNVTLLVSVRRYIAA